MKAGALWCSLLVTSAVCSAQVPVACDLVPGWQQFGAGRQYTADNLYEYMDGNAEGYLLYGFVRMQGVTCKSAANTVVIDISEMADSDLAYGMFAANADPKAPTAPIGMIGQIQPRRASFAKGIYYVEIAASPDVDHTAALQAFTAKIDAGLKGLSSLPEALTWFPREKLTSVRLVPESVLGLRQLKRGFVAKYAQGQAFIVSEASQEAAAQTFSQLRKRFADSSPAPVGDEALQAKTQYLDAVCIFRKGRHIAGYANLTDAQEAIAQAKNLAERIP
ncbi:MAG TPA: DUF6599 family protein [Terriglobales bacterium]|jgi:hypothetical protein|nr:DUF6599 family protein [Terriglobales bacterium]